MERCSWANVSERDQAYHDKEWGVPVHDDQRLFEMLILEGAQAGLSWATILKKREGYREAFDHFHIETVAAYDENKIAALLANPAIVRNKLKVNGTVINANLVLEIQKEYGSFNEYIWQFVDGKPRINHWETMADVPTSTPESDAMSKALKKKGFKFVGSTICYAYMQATGMVNDHLTSCFRYGVDVGE
ncbi:DNA-3-methyladenine glycosylase I [Grimontia hollisae]|uniref:DNA-3-methyladenine glycosylase I n=1 Tax=Grimontia hollisae TaxID=673 RepID=UPI0013037C0B|nr:DNA-3-methyladenine glycosylase I [Grimontia hollisae]MDF2186514.1 DNA-3-methyladenine glycosylase I [Grimontia hollisae]